MSTNSGKMWSAVHGAYIPDHDAPDPRDATITSLQAEVLRLREALKPIASAGVDISHTAIMFDPPNRADDVIAAARAALGGDDAG